MPQLCSGSATLLFHVPCPVDDVLRSLVSFALEAPFSFMNISFLPFKDRQASLSKKRGGIRQINLCRRIADDRRDAFQRIIERSGLTRSAFFFGDSARPNVERLTAVKHFFLCTW